MADKTFVGAAAKGIGTLTTVTGLYHPLPPPVYFSLPMPQHDQ
jgi:hypothetical protein